MLFTSGYTQNSIVHNGQLDADVTLLSKPWRLDALARAVRSSLDGAPARPLPRRRVLLVEDDFVYPAREVDGGLEPVGEPGAPGALDDAVDELIDMVLTSSGDVVIVEPGALGEHGPIALLLRY